MRTVRPLPLVAAAALLALCAWTPLAQAQIKLRYAHVGVANAPQTLYADEEAMLVKERTAGRGEIQVFANSQLDGVGETVDGVESGAIAWPNGRLPLNTAGGSLSEAYIHGLNHVVEGVKQLRGTAVSQVSDAELCLVASGTGIPPSALVLRR